MSEALPSLVGHALLQGSSFGEVRRNLLISASLGFIAAKVSETSSKFEVLGVSLPTDLAAGALCVATSYFLAQLLAINFAHLGTFFRPLKHKLDAASARLKLARAMADTKTAAQIEEAERIVSELEQELSANAITIKYLESETKNPVLWVLMILNYAIPLSFGIYVILELFSHFSITSFLF